MILGEMVPTLYAPPPLRGQSGDLGFFFLSKGIEHQTDNSMKFYLFSHSY